MICRACNKEFSGVRHDRRYCSIKCHKILNRKAAQIRRARYKEIDPYYDGSNSRKTRYGINNAQYKKQTLFQNNRCAICDHSMSHKRHKLLNVDHNHLTKQLRGLLCSNCNCMLGMARDNATILAKGAIYLEHGGIWNA